MTYNIFTKALDILDNLERESGFKAHNATSHTVKQSALSEAAAYNKAWWILHYAIHEDWDMLDKYDIRKDEE